jgi:hypothetical protein
MANTERLAAIQKVRLAYNAAQEARQRPDVTPAEQTTLTKLAFSLEDVEDDLILEDLASHIDAITQAAVGLKAAVDAISAAQSHIAYEVALVADAAKAINGLASVLSTAAAHGLLG